MWIAPKRSRTLSCGHVDSAHELSHVDTWTALTKSLMWICGQRSRTVSFGCGKRTTIHELSPVDIHADMWIPCTNSLIWMWIANDCSWTLCRGYVDIWIALTNSIMSCVEVCCRVLQCVAVYVVVCSEFLQCVGVIHSLMSSWSMLLWILFGIRTWWRGIRQTIICTTRLFLNSPINYFVLRSFWLLEPAKSKKLQISCSKYTWDFW